MRRFLIWSTAGLLLLILAAGLAALEITSRLSPLAQESRKVLVSVPRGATPPQIGRLLEESGVIRSGEAFRYYVAYRKVGPKLKAGEHQLDASMSIPEVVSSLIEGRYKMYRLTVPEGLTMDQVAALAAQTGLADEAEFKRLCRDPEFISARNMDVPTLEGYLFPETYHFVRGTSTAEIVTAMVDRFRQVWEKLEPLARTSELTPHQVVTLASIIEKETGAAEERPLISAVFHNRLKRGMRLETDPTVIYGIKNFNGNLTRKHLETYSPYNTYLIDGLPPGPIANPGAESLEAALNPAQVNYLFFVSKNDGTHQFSGSLREHNQAVNRYQRRR